MGNDDIYRSAWQASPLAIVTLSAEGPILSCNPACERLFARQSDELIAVDLVSLSFPLDRGALEQMLAEARQGKTPARQEIRFHRPGGEVIVAGFSVSPARGPDEAVVCVLRDLSREKAFRPKLLHTERMASIGTIASVVAHELNNAFAGALGCLQLLPPQVEADDRELLESVVGELRRAADIVRELKGYARVEEGMSDTIQVSELLNRLERLRRYHASRDRPTALEVQVEDSLPELRGNANQLLQALLNLVRNAEQAASELPEDRRTIRVRAFASDGVVVIEVADRGPGVPRELRARLFEPFYSTKPATDGTGLGLTVVQAVAAGHGGRVEISKTPGGGATFALMLPCDSVAAAEASAARTLKAPSGYPRLSGARILVADDEPIVLRVVDRACSAHGCVIVGVGRGDEAVQALHGRSFDMVLLDVRMPGGGGATVFRHIREHHAELVPRTLFMSGDLSADMAELVGTGHAGVLHKPFELHDLLGTLDGVLA